MTAAIAAAAASPATAAAAAAAAAAADAPGATKARRTPWMAARMALKSLTDTDPRGEGRWYERGARQTRKIAGQRG